MKKEPTARELLHLLATELEAVVTEREGLEGVDSANDDLLQLVNDAREPNVKDPIGMALHVVQALRRQPFWVCPDCGDDYGRAGLCPTCGTEVQQQGLENPKKWVECMDCGNRYPYSEPRWSGVQHCEGCDGDGYFRVSGTITEYELSQRDEQPALGREHHEPNKERS